MRKIYLNRLHNLHQDLNDNNLDAMYITNLTNIRYLTGFTGSAGSVLVLPDKQIFITDGRYIEQSKNQVKEFEIIITNENHLNTIKKGGFLDTIHSLAFEGQHVSFSQYETIKNTFSSLKLIKTEMIIEHLAAIKDKEEIDSLKTAVEITDQVFLDIMPDLKVGAIEKEISAKISFLFKKHGADGDAYDPIIASGLYAALPHARPSDKKFENEDFVVMDFGALYNGYHADMTRTVVIGKATEKHKEIYQIVLDSQLTGIASAKAGITGKELDTVCRNVIKDSGYGDNFIHSTGHGLGLEIHTYPRISQFNEKKLLENYIITIEPGIYIANWGGVRIEDDCLITKDGCIPFNKSTKEMLVLG